MLSGDVARHESGCHNCWLSYGFPFLDSLYQYLAEEVFLEESDDEPSKEELCADSLGYNLGLKYEDEIIPYLEDKTNINDRYNLLAYIPVLEVNIYQFKYQKDIYMIRYIQDGKIIFINSDFDEFNEWELIDLMN